MDFHDAANIFPLDEENLEALAEDIRANGQQVEIEVFCGKIIDGRRRWMACEKAGVQPRTRHVAPTDPIAYVLSLNLHRRHLSITQLGMVGGRAREMYDMQAEERRREAAARGNKVRHGKESSVVENLPPPAHDAGKARDKVGAAVGVSGKTIDQASKVLRQGTPKLIAATEADKIAVSTAARASSLSPEEQDALADRAQDGRPRSRPSEVDNEPEPEEIKLKGVGVILANEALNSLRRIPKTDALRKRGFQIITDWIKHNR